MAGFLHPSPTKVAVLDPIYMQSQTATAVALERQIVRELHSAGYTVEAAHFICDDPDAGAQYVHAEYYVLSKLSADSKSVRLVLYHVSNGHPLRDILVALRDNTLPPNAFAKIMNRLRWSHRIVAATHC